MRKREILVAEDDLALAGRLEALLVEAGYLPLMAETGHQALMLVSSYLPDLVLLNLGLPGLDGMAVLEELRRWYQKPILILSADGREERKVAALDLGANDYITKPFGERELLARIRAALRYSRGHTPLGQERGAFYQVGGLRVDFDRHQVTVEGERVHLTRLEFRIVELLAANGGRVLSHDFILRHIWGPYYDGSNKILRVNMTNIRRKLEPVPSRPRYLLTQAGVGYRMVGQEEWERAQASQDSE